MAFPLETFPNLAALTNYVNTYIIPNGMNLIDGIEDNNVLNGLAFFINQYLLNNAKAVIWSTGGAVIAPSVGVPGPFVIFMGPTPSSFTFGNVVWNEYYIVNATTNNLPLGTVFYDSSLSPQTVIPPQSVIHIALATNGQWIQVGGLSIGGGGNIKPALTGIAGDGGDEDPIVGESTYQSGLLVGLPARIMININGAPLLNYGAASQFDFDPTTGEITDLPNPWALEDSLYIDLNQ
jgi:hypothetical protein